MLNASSPITRVDWFSTCYLRVALRATEVSAWFPHSTWYFGVSGVNHLCIFKPEGRVVQKCSKTNRFYTFDKVPSPRFVVFLLTAWIYSNQNVGEYGLTEGIHYTIYRSVHRVCTRSLLRKVCLHTTIKSEHCLLLTILTMLKEQSAVFYVTPHWVSNWRIIYSLAPKRSLLNHLFFPLLHYFHSILFLNIYYTNFETICQEVF